MEKNWQGPPLLYPTVSLALTQLLEALPAQLAASPVLTERWEGVTESSREIPPLFPNTQASSKTGK